MTPERSDLVDGAIGELSAFHDTFGYYAQGVGEGTAVLPAGWEDRLVPVPTIAVTGLCLEPHDLVLSKYVAGREKGHDYVRMAARYRLVERATLLARLEATPVDAEQKRRIIDRVEADFGVSA